MEPFYPLHAYVCGECFLVQLQEYRVARRDLHRVRLLLVVLDELGRARTPATSSHGCRAVRPRAASAGSWRSPATTATCCSTSWHAACRCLASSRRRTWRRRQSRRASRPRSRFFGDANGRRRSLAEHGRADLLLGNNVLAHVPDLNDFVAGMKLLLAPDGVITMEFPHLLRLMDGEPVRHDLPRALLATSRSLAVERVFAQHGLALFDVEELPTHGGSLRIYARHAEDAAMPSGERVNALRAARERRRLRRPRALPRVRRAGAGRPSASCSRS